MKISRSRCPFIARNVWRSVPHPLRDGVSLMTFLAVLNILVCLGTLILERTMENDIFNLKEEVE